LKICSNKNKSEESSFYSPFKAWKFYIVSQEICIILNIVITTLFFAMLYRPGFCKLSKKNDEFNGLPCFIELSSHSFPLICSFIEYCLNVSPLFLKRHWSLMLALSFIYLVVNIIVSKARNKPVYSILTHDSVFSWSLSIGILILNVVLFFLFSYLNNKKLQAFGFKEEFMIENKDDILNQNEK